MTEETLQLQLGDIIQINSPTNDRLNEQIFLITYIDSKNVEIKDIVTLKKTTLELDDQGELEDDSIDSISLLSRDEQEGYARQHGLLPKTWVTITLGGDLPAIFSGQITNLEEDMIEVQTFPEKETIYIDFAYNGIPKDIPIKSIEIRDPPDLEVSAVPGPETGSEPLPESKVQVTVPVPDVKQQLQQFIIQADDITFGKDLGEITQMVQLDDSYEKFGIQTQTNDLLDEILATIPNAKRNKTVLNRIHLMIERFKELRDIFSEKDDYGNPTHPITKGAGYKPLVESLKRLNKSLYWILPVVKNKKRVYDLDEAETDEVDDVVALTMSESQIQDTDALDKYRQNAIPDSENKYDYLLKIIQENGETFESPDGDNDDFLTRQEVNTNLNMVVDNLDDFYSSIVSKESLTRKRYLMTKYNLGFTKLETVIEQGSKPYNRRIQATPNTKVFLKSLMLLPENVVRFSRIQLPGSSILLKSALNKEGFKYYKRFTKNTTINTEIIQSFEAPKEHTFLQGATEIILDDSLQTEENKYEKYLQSVIPRTKLLFNMVKKYIDEKLTMSEVVKELEPFLIYSDDLTYKQYREINTFIKGKINEYKKSFVSKNREFRSLQSGKKFADKTRYYLFNILKKEKKTVMEEGYGLQMRGYTSSENYAKIMKMDSGRLFMTAIAIENLFLMTPVDINDIFEREKLAIKDGNDTSKTTPMSGETSDNKCASYTLVKRYLDLDEMLEDNGKEVYIDKNLDKTRYDIVEEYSTERESMSASDFQELLIEKLMSNIGLSEEKAKLDAAAMILGKRPVEEGQYASLEIDGGEKMYYYKRVGNVWERDETIPDVKMDDSMFCNIQSSCIKLDKSTECESTDEGTQQINETSLDTLIKEFDIKYEVSKEEMTRMIENRFAYLRYRLAVLKKIRLDERYQYNDRQLKMGMELDDEDPILVSPYAKLRDAILGQPDIVKRNNDIVRFQTLFTRDSGTEEDKFWFYCKETNIKLLPTFVVTLASTFIQDQYNYVKVLDQICANQGKLSDDGNAWVDEHSGYVIKMIEFSTEEGYEDSGFKTVSREILRDELRTLRAGELEKKFSDPNAEKISNIIQALAAYMGFSIESMQEFIIRNTLLITSRIVPSEEEYNKKREALAKKGKKVPEFIDAYHTSMLLVTFVYFLVGIQISIPSIKTRKQFPGCKRSFEGFPLDGNGDDSAINYVACVANKIKSGVSPWNVLKKMNSVGIAKRIKDLISKYVVPDGVIQTLFNEKRAFLLEGKDDEIPVELDISRWQTFLPPLVPIVTTPKEEITTEFKNELIQNIRSGKSQQAVQLQTLQGNMIHYPTVMIEEIQKIISKETPILTNMANDAFLENACCIDDEDDTTINYFMRRIPALSKYNAFVKKLHSIYNDITGLSVAPRIFSPNNTRRVYPPLSNSFSKKTIYRAFIHFCQFGTLFPVPEKLQLVCMTKPPDFSLLDPLSIQIRNLEEEGKNYTLDDMETLLYIINRENILHVSLYDEEETTLEKLRTYLKEDIVAIPKKLHGILVSIVDTFEISVPEETREMKLLINYLDKEITLMKTEIITFMQRNTKMNKRKFNQVVEIIQNNSWKDDDNQLRAINYMENMIRDLTQVFPNMVVNSVDYDEVSFPKHWRKTLSDRHISDIRNIIYNYYRSLSKFYGNEVLIKLLEHITSKTAMWRDFISVLPIFERIENDGHYPSLNTSMVYSLVEYSLLQCYTVFITTINETSPIGFPIRETEALTAMTTEEIVNEEIGNISEIDIISGEKLERSELMTGFLLQISEIFGKTKSLLDYSYSDVIYRVNVSKEKEKDQFTKRLKDLSDEEREIENLMKNHKLGEWSKGLSKGVTQYERDTYDEERNAMEKIIAMEREIGKSDFVSDMNRDIYVNEAFEEARRAAEIDAEEMRIEYMGEDADYEEMGLDGDERF